MAAIVAADAPTTTMQYDGSISSEGKFHGKGSIVYSNGEKYAGDWEHGQRHGTGVYTYADGGSYDGQWDRDKISGEGRARYADGNVYEGSWVNGKIHGTGKLETSKFSYDGEWRDGKKHGEGSCRYHDNGDDYEGSWAEDKWHGHGVWTLRGEDGSVHEKFVGDMLNGQMQLSVSAVPSVLRSRRWRFCVLSPSARRRRDHVSPRSYPPTTPSP